MPPALLALYPRLQPAGMVWVSWRKKSSGAPSEVKENDIRRIGLAAGLVDIKVCAVSETWSGLKFVIPREDRPTASRKSLRPRARS